MNPCEEKSGEVDRNLRASLSFCRVLQSIFSVGKICNVNLALWWIYTQHAIVSCGFHPLKSVARFATESTCNVNFATDSLWDCCEIHSRFFPSRVNWALRCTIKHCKRYWYRKVFVYFTCIMVKCGGSLTCLHSVLWVDFVGYVFFDLFPFRFLLRAPV